MCRLGWQLVGGMSMKRGKRRSLMWSGGACGAESDDRIGKIVRRFTYMCSGKCWPWVAVLWPLYEFRA
jgi:hypothetical protein